MSAKTVRDLSKVRMVAASAIESYLYLVTMCSKEEAWWRIKLIREAMKESTTEEVRGAD